MSYRINNPGGGDCGFYAFSIGLIDIIQNEHKLHGKSDTFDRWKQEGLAGVNLKDILDIDLNQLYQSPFQYKKDVLFRLQMSLRHMTVMVSHQDLFERIKKEAKEKDKPTLVEGSTIYNKFIEVVHHYAYNKGTLNEISKFNELALSPEVLKLAERTAKSLTEKLKNKSFAERQKIEQDHVKEALLTDVLSGKNINLDSALLKGTEKVGEQGRWATHCDLKEIAEQLKVNFLVSGQVDGRPNPHLPTVTLNNEGNGHWTTRVEQLPEPKPQPIVVKEMVAPLKQDKTVTPVPAETVTAITKTEKESQTPARKKRTINTEPKSEETLSSHEKQVIEATLSTQVQEDKTARYREHVKDLVHASTTHGLFSHVKNKIDVNAIDSAVADVSIDEKDEDFAARLQEAELRKAGLM